MQDSGGPGGLFEPLKQEKVKNDKKNVPSKRLKMTKNFPSKKCDKILFSPERVGGGRLQEF